MNTVLFTEKEIQDKVKELGQFINNQNHEKPPIFVCVLNGGFMFFSDIVRYIDKCEIDFIRAKSYDDMKQGEIYISKTIDIDIEGRDVYLIDDIYDSGNTINRLIKHLNYRKPNSITPVTLFKRQNSVCNINLMYGFELINEAWLIGYGLDAVDGTQRNLRYIKGIDD